VTISFPLLMPTKVFTRSRFKIVAPTTRTRLKSSATFGTAIGAQGWLAEITTRPLMRDEQGAWLAFFDSLRGGVYSCLLYNPNKEYPLKYKFTGFLGLKIAGTTDNFEGMSSILNKRDARTISLNRLPPAFVLSTGDHVGVIKENRYSLHRVQQDAIANSNGIIYDLSVEPSLSDFFGAGSDVTVYQAKCEFTVDDESVSGDDETAAPHAISFTAMSRPSI